MAPRRPVRLECWFAHLMWTWSRERERSLRWYTLHGPKGERGRANRGEERRALRYRGRGGNVRPVRGAREVLGYNGRREGERGKGCKGARGGV